MRNLLTFFLFRLLRTYPDLLSDILTGVSGEQRSELKRILNNQATSQ